MILFQQPYLTIEFDAKLNCLIQHWNGFAKSEQFREGINQSIEIAKQKHYTNLISDTKNLAIIKKDDTEWVATHATPILVASGLRHMAFIVPTNAFTQLSVNNFTSQTSGILHIQYFDELEKAKEWLASVE